MFVRVVKTMCNDRNRMRGGDGTLMEDRSPVASVFFFCSAEVTKLSRWTVCYLNYTRHNSIFPE